MTRSTREISIVPRNTIFRIIFSNVDLSATMQSRICIVGENGAGKTTLLKIIMEMMDPWKGTRVAHRNLKFGYFTQVNSDGME